MSLNLSIVLITLKVTEGEKVTIDSTKLSSLASWVNN